MGEATLHNANSLLSNHGDCATIGVVQSEASILRRWLLKRRQIVLMELAEIEDALQLPRTKPARNR